MHDEAGPRPMPELLRDFQIPLSQVVLLTQDVLAEMHGSVSDSAQRQLETLLESAERLQSVFDELLEASREATSPRQQINEQGFAANGYYHPPVTRLTSADAAFLNTLTADIDSHLTDHDYSVSTMAAHVSLSTSQLQRRLRYLLKESPARLIRRMRLEYAADLLVRDTGTVSEIACASGFNSQSYFARAFKLHYGMTPSDYRAAERGDTERGDADASLTAGRD